MSDLTVREWHLVRRPDGMPSAGDFAIESRSLPAPGPGQARVRNLFLSVDPYMRGRMRDRPSYVPPFPLDAPLDGGAVGRVEDSRHPALSPGQLVYSMHGWREGYLTDGAGVTAIDPALAPPEAWLGTLGMPGLTAYAGLFDVGGLQSGETVLVTAAGGAVGMVACQIAKAKDCRVIGVAGAEPKLDWLRRHGAVDVAVNYRTAPSLVAAIRDAAPNGVDLTFENVGGEQLEAALGAARRHGRIVICGMISALNATEPPAAPRNLREVLVKRLTMRGFLVFDHEARRPDFLRDMAEWIRAGRMQWTETVVDGFERMPDAFLGLFSGSNLGKMVVRCGDPTA